MVRQVFTSGIVIAALEVVAVAQSVTDDAPTAKLWSVDAAVVERHRAEDLQILSTIVTENVNGLYGVESRRVAGGTDATGPMTRSGALSSAGAWLYVAGGHPTTPAQPTRALAEYLPDYGVVVQMEVAPPREP